MTEFKPEFYDDAITKITKMLVPTSSRAKKEVPCTVCGKATSNVRCGIMACEACKKFFLRNRASYDILPCKTGLNNCEIIHEWGNPPCSKCRLRKCFLRGMRVRGTNCPMVATDSASAVDEQSPPIATDYSTPMTDDAALPVDVTSPLALQTPNLAMVVSDPVSFDAINAEQIINTAVMAQQWLGDLVNLPLTHQSMTGSMQDSSSCWKGAMANYTLMSTACAAFIKRLPGYVDMTPTDRSQLFGKAIVPMAVSYLSVSSGLPFFGMNNYNKSEFLHHFPTFKRSAGQLEEVAAAIANWRPSDAELALLQALIFYQGFSTKKVENEERLQEMTAWIEYALKLYLARDPNGNRRVNQFMRIFSMLRMAAANHGEMVAYFQRSRPDLVGHNKAYSEMMALLVENKVDSEAKAPPSSSGWLENSYDYN